MEENRPAQQQYEQRRAEAAANDGELLKRAAGGDVAAQHALIERHGRYLYGVAYALANNAQDAEDLVQETFMGAFRTRFRGESALRTWLVKILMRRAGMMRRWRGRQVPSVPLGTSSDQTPRGDEPASATGAAGGASADARLDLAAMLQTLSPEHRQVILLREIEGMSYEQIAEAIGAPRGTVESRLHRAREELRRRFKGYL